jgi:type III secretory pathway lipoprotein EscJ
LYPVVTKQFTSQKIYKNNNQNYQNTIKNIIKKPIKTYTLENCVSLLFYHRTEQKENKNKQKNRLTHKNMYQPIILIHSKNNYTVSVSCAVSFTPALS